MSSYFCALEYTKYNIKPITCTINVGSLIFNRNIWRRKVFGYYHLENPGKDTDFPPIFKMFCNCICCVFFYNKYELGGVYIPTYKQRNIETYEPLKWMVQSQSKCKINVLFHVFWMV